MAVVAVDAGVDGAVINIEVDDELTTGQTDLSDVYGDDPTRNLASRVIVKAARPLFQEGLNLVQECARAVVAKVDQMGDERPDDFEMELAVKLDNKVGAKLVELTGGAQMLVRLKWHRPS